MGPLFFILLLAWPAAAQEPVFRAETAWVRVDAQVWDGRRVVAGLERQDFLVYDEGPRDIAYFGREAEPLDVLLLLDVSGSMRRHVEEMARHAREALRQLNLGDRAGVMLFSRRAEIREDLTADFARVEAGLRDAVREQGLGGGTRITSAVIAAAEHMGRGAGGAADGPRPGRRAIVILTDNDSMDYRLPDQEAIRALLETDTVLNALVVGRGERPAPPPAGQYVNPDFTRADVFHMAEETGGVAIQARRAGESFRTMMESIRARYHLQYRAPEGVPAGTFRRIRVELSPEARKRYPRATVLARSGYVVK